MNLIQKPETLIVTRDGQLDDEYYDAVYAARKREVLHQAGHNVVRFAVNAPIVVGRGVVYLFTHELTDSLQVK